MLSFVANIHEQLKTNNMKKQLLLLVALLCLTNAKAEDRVEKFGIFNHVSVGAGVGILDGISFEAAAPITDFVQLRLGYSFLPKFSYTTDISYKDNGQDKETDVKFQLNQGNFKFLFDILPFRTSSFHVTVGGYVGKEHFVKAWNSSPIYGLLPGEGLLVGEYIIRPNDDPTSPDYGVANAAIQVNKFKPYVGIGVGRACPRKRVSVTGDFGVMFWGSPNVVAKADDGTWQKMTKDNIGHDSEKAFKIMSKIIVCPVLSIRVNGRIF